MDTSQIIEKIQVGLNDPAILESTILTAINQKLKMVANQIRLPDLIEEDIVYINAGANYGDMPDNFDHDILYAYSDTNSLDLVLRANSRVLFKDRDRTALGSVTEVAKDGKVLRTWNGSTAKDVINLEFYGKPEDLEDDDDEPECIPDHLREDVLAQGVIYEFMSLRRPVDTVDQKMAVDTKNDALTRHKTGIALLQEYYKDAPQAQPVLRRSTRTF